MERHARDEYLIVGEGVVSGDPDAGGRRTRAGRAATADSDVAGAAGAAGGVGADAEPVFRFSRLGPKGTAVGTPLRRKLAAAMTQATGQRDSGIAAGFTYLGQFIDHDLTSIPVR